MATAVRLALGTSSALGLARFAYGLLVPALQGDLGWTLADAGALSTANGLGYVVGAVLTAALIRRWGTASVFRWGMAATAATLAGTAASNEFVVLVAMRALAGAARAAVFIAGGVIAARLAARAGSSAPVAVYFAGTGAGIVLSGAAIPALGDHWRAAWIGLGIAVGVATLISWSATGPDEEKATDGAGRARVRPLRRVALAYLLFAVGYITYIAFLSVYLADRHASVLQEILTWTVLGAGVMATPFLWSRPMTRWPGARVLAAVLGGLAGGAALPLLPSSAIAVVASAAAYGVTFVAVPTVVTACIRTVLQPVDWTATFAAFTTLFAAGQTVGPWLAGVLAEHATTAAPLAWTALLSAGTAVLSAIPSRPEPRTETTFGTNAQNMGSRR
ncbi:YbfB/YjiJ family MFS transporter [Streptomyces sp. NPDC054844]